MQGLEINTYPNIAALLNTFLNYLEYVTIYPSPPSMWIVIDTAWFPAGSIFQERQ